MKLSELSLGQMAIIREIHTQDISPSTIERLGEMGFAVGSRVTALHTAIGGDPMAYEVRGGMVALRKTEADCVEVVLVTGEKK